MSNHLNLSEIDQEQAFNLLKLSIKTGQNIFLFGRRGIGKTHLALDAAKKTKIKVNYINLSVIERADLAGYPDLSCSGDVVNFKSPYFLPTGAEQSILLFDEVDKASPEITAPLLEILQFKKINGKPINICSCILTGNLASENVYSNAISTALLDRGSKYLLKFDFDKWFEWAQKNNIDELILGFLKYDNTLVCGKIDDMSYASPSPRSWTLASDAIKKAKQHKIYDIETISNIVSGYVGNEVGLKFKNWFMYYKQFEPYLISIIDKYEIKIDFESLKPTEKLVFIVGLCACAKNSFLYNKKHDSLINLSKFLSLPNISDEIKLAGLVSSFNFEMITKYKLYLCKEFFELFKTITQKINLK